MAPLGTSRNLSMLAGQVFPKRMRARMVLGASSSVLAKSYSNIQIRQLKESRRQVYEFRTDRGAETPEEEC